MIAYMFLGQEYNYIGILYVYNFSTKKLNKFFLTYTYISKIAEFSSVCSALT